ncbi:MAG: hypothetical protein IPM32_05080 [Ignavibacteriae bacterium]|nr:hypothetical protein [Ignavibacteriota bacterium]
MKIKYLSMFLFFILIFLFVYSCSENSLSDNNEEINFKAHQIAGCNNSYSLEKINFSDSCFNYTFDETLKIDFCVYGNCCPDSNRFDVNYELNSDTIYVTVTDTAANLCRCLCNYKIHLELTGLQKDQYVFYSNFNNILVYNEIISKLNK